MKFTSNVGNIPGGAASRCVPFARPGWGLGEGGGAVGATIRGPSGPGRSSIKRRREASGRLAAVACILLLLLGCAELVPPPPPPPPPPPDGENLQQSLLVANDVAALEVSFAFDPSDVAFRGLSEIGAGVTSASYVAPDGRSATVHVFSETPLAGSVLKLHWVVAEGATGPPLSQVAAYRSDGSAANGSVSLGPLAKDTTTDPVPSSSNLSSFSAGDQAREACLEASYDAETADYPLGDLDRSGDVDIRDVVLAHAQISESDIDLEDPFQLFQLDLTGDCAYDQSDVERLFMK